MCIYIYIYREREILVYIIHELVLYVTCLTDLDPVPGEIIIIVVIGILVIIMILLLLLLLLDVAEDIYMYKKGLYIKSHVDYYCYFYYYYYYYYYHHPYYRPCDAMS